MKAIRNELWEKLTSELKAINKSRVEEWPCEFPDYEPVVLKRIDNKSQRILTIELDVEREREYDFCIRKTGLYFEQRDLLVIYGDPISNSKKISEIYKLWFIDNLSEVDMEAYLESQRKFYRHRGVSY